MINIREEISKILVKWDMPTRQAAISDIQKLIDKILIELAKEIDATNK